MGPAHPQHKHRRFDGISIFFLFCKIPFRSRVPGRQFFLVPPVAWERFPASFSYRKQLSFTIAGTTSLTPLLLWVLNNPLGSHNPQLSSPYCGLMSPPCFCLEGGRHSLIPFSTWPGVNKNSYMLLFVKDFYLSSLGWESPSSSALHAPGGGSISL